MSLRDGGSLAELYSPSAAVEDSPTFATTTSLHAPRITHYDATKVCLIYRTFQNLTMRDYDRERGFCELLARTVMTTPDITIIPPRICDM